MQSLFPVTDRYSGISFNFSLGMGLLGGMTPIVYVNMIEKYQASLLFPAFSDRVDHSFWGHFDKGSFIA